MSKICVIIPYFGEWPNYFPHFLKSVVDHPFLHFLFFTDIETNQPNQSNIRYQKSSISSIEKLIQAKMQLACPLRFSYKLCDIRPAYGHLFENEIVDYDFWAFGDIDVLYGNIDNFLSMEDINQYDVFSVRQEYCSGPLCIFRNTPKINRLYQQSKDYKKIFTSSEYFNFDECNFQWTQIRLNNELAFQPSDIEHFTYVIKSATREGKIRSQFITLIKESIAKGDFVKCAQSQISDREGREYLFYHLITEKKNRGFTLPNWPQIPELYYISPLGAYLPNQMNGTTYKLINSHRRLKQFFNDLTYYAKRAVEKIILNK